MKFSIAILVVSLLATCGLAQEPAADDENKPTPKRDFKAFKKCVRPCPLECFTDFWPENDCRSKNLTCACAKVINNKKVRNAINDCLLRDCGADFSRGANACFVAACTKINGDQFLGVQSSFDEGADDVAETFNDYQGDGEGEKNLDERDVDYFNESFDEWETS